MAEIIALGRRPAAPEAANDETLVERAVLCTSCRHEWRALAPVGVRWFECPACGLHRGANKLWFGPSEGTKVWACNGCDGTTMTVYLAPDAAPCLMCCECGAAHNALDLFPDPG